jgi:hypothetical protein
MKILNKTITILKLMGLVVIVYLILWFFVFTDFGDDKRVKLVYDAVTKIEEYRNQNGKLPGSFRDIGLNYDESGPIYYDIKKDGSDYTISFGSYGVGHSIFYDPKTKTWGEVW